MTWSSKTLSQPSKAILIGALFVGLKGGDKTFLQSLRSLKLPFWWPRNAPFFQVNPQRSCLLKLKYVLICQTLESKLEYIKLSRARMNTRTGMRMMFGFGLKGEKNPCACSQVNTIKNNTMDIRKVITFSIFIILVILYLV
jgi:hypothetical protein